jgi:hypothetical protein
MLAEKRARAKELMATAMSQFAQSSPGAPSQAAKDLPEGQRAGVCQDLIDVYFESGSESYRRDLEGGIQALCGNDALIVLKKTANGIGPHELDVLVQRDQAMQQAIDHLGKGESVVPAGDPKKH